MEPHSSKKEPDMVFETVLYQEIGQYGKFQLINILLLAFPALFCACMAGDYVFTAGSLPHRCLIPECDGQTPEYAPDWILNVIPHTSSGLDNCNRYVNTTDNVEIAPDTEDVCPAILFNRNITEPCESYVYERNNTVVYDFGLECQEWLRTLPGTLNSLGGMVALATAGYVSDNFGRRTSVVIFSFNIALVGVVRAFSINYPMFVALQFLQTAIGGGAFSAAYILAAEIVGPTYRVITSATISTMFALGHVYLGLIAYAVPRWRELSLALFSPVFLLVLYQWLLAESPRWLLTKKNNGEAKISVVKAARLNGREVPAKSMEFLLAAFTCNTENKKSVSKENLFLRVIKSPVLLRRCCTTPILWITTVFIYYGLSINSVHLSGNMYVNYIAVGAIEIPGFWTAVLVLDRIGRRITLFLGFLVCALCNIAFAFTPNNIYGLSLFLFLTGKYCIGLVMTSLYLYTAELYPTRYRHSFLAFSSMVGRIGSIVSPLTPPLMAYWTGIPSMLFAGMALISAFAVLTQPETLGLKVPDTIEDAENLGKKKLPVT